MVAHAWTEGDLMSARRRQDAPRPTLRERAVDRIPFLEKELFLLRRLVVSGDTCIDVGAAGGAHLVTMARRVGRTGRVVGIEPRRGSLRVLRWLVRMLRLTDRVRLLATALSDQVGDEPLRVPVVPTRAHLRGSASDAERHAAFARLPHRRVRVPTTTLDSVVAGEGLDTVDVVKCDVEGAELAVVEGAGDTLRRLRPIVIVEADDIHQRRFDSSAQQVLDAVIAHGYTPHRYARGHLHAVDGVVDDEDDYVLLPHETDPDALLARTG